MQVIGVLEQMLGLAIPAPACEGHAGTVWSEGPMRRAVPLLISETTLCETGKGR